jgi:hypothetical protein
MTYLLINYLFNPLSASQRLHLHLLGRQPTGTNVIKRFWSPNIQHNDTQHNDTQQHYTQYNDTQHNDTQHNDTQPNNTQNKDTQQNYTQ